MPQYACVAVRWLVGLAAAQRFVTLRDLFPAEAPVLAPNQQTVKGLTYPWGCDVAPGPGQMHAVAPGIWWLHMPLPFALNRINLWLLEDGAGWTIVDTGINSPGSREVWEAVFATVLQDRPVLRVIATHMHPDHVGLAGWLAARFSCELWMSRTEFLMCRNLVADTGRQAPDAALRFYRAVGFSDEMIAVYRERFGEFGSYIAPLPDDFRRLVDGQTISINGQYWQVVVGHGHSPEHVCLYCPAQRVLISGDQVIPRISSNVSVFPTEPQGDPLSEWLASCHRLRLKIPNDVLVLPAHQEPFYGLHARLTQLLSSHERSLDRLFAHLTEPRRVLDCFSVLFKRSIRGANVMLATGESLAHLHCLISRGMVGVRQDEQGVNWYQQLPDAALLPE